MVHCKLYVPDWEVEERKKIYTALDNEGFDDYDHFREEVYKRASKRLKKRIDWEREFYKNLEEGVHV